jgi:hypothetical protein
MAKMAVFINAPWGAALYRGDILYIKTSWRKGDLITADRLNHIENGIEAAGDYAKYVDYVLYDSGITYITDASDGQIAYDVSSYGQGGSVTIDAYTRAQGDWVGPIEVTIPLGGSFFAQSYWYHNAEADTEVLCIAKRPGNGLRIYKLTQT